MTQLQLIQSPLLLCCLTTAKHVFAQFVKYNVVSGNRGGNRVENNHVIGRKEGREVQCSHAAAVDLKQGNTGGCRFCTPAYFVGHMGVLCTNWYWEVVQKGACSAQKSSPAAIVCARGSLCGPRAPAEFFLLTTLGSSLFSCLARAAPIVQLTFFTLFAIHSAVMVVHGRGLLFNPFGGSSYVSGEVHSLYAELAFGARVWQSKC